MMSAKSTDGNTSERRGSDRRIMNKDELLEALNKYFIGAKRNIRAVSVMMEDEWDDSEGEREFLKLNLETARRGVRLERIFIFKAGMAEKFRKNRALEAFRREPGVECYFIDAEKLFEKEKNSIGDGWVMVDDEVLLVDLPGTAGRGYLEFSGDEIREKRAVFERLVGGGRVSRDI
jgi:hypothetical protein